MTGKMEDYNYKFMLVTEPEDWKMISKEIKEQFYRKVHIYKWKKEQDLEKYIQEIRPDAIILSFSCITANYIAAVKRIREINPQISICTCTAFYSQELIGELILQGIDGYLIHPVRKAQLQMVIQKMKDILVKRVQSERKKEKEEAYLSRIRMTLENGFIYCILYGGGSKEQLRAYKDALGVPDYGAVLTVECGKQMLDSSKEELYRRRIKIALVEIPSTGNEIIVGPRIFNRFILYIPMEQEISEQEKKENQKHLEGILKKMISGEVRVFLGERYPLEEIYKSYQDALKKQYKKKEIKRGIFLKREKFIGHKEYTKLINQLLDSVKFGRSNAEATFHKLLENMEGLTYRAKVNKIVQILVLCCHAAYIEGDNELPFWDCGQMIKELDEPVENLERWANQKFEQILSIILQHQERNTSQIVKQAIEYIEEQYATEISLEEVAKYVGVTPQHFSKIFKMETGIKYVDWLSELRIERAKEYLMEEKYTVKEICFFVGYRDPNYFSRIFKKMVGVPPSKYREGM
ncbi:MAG: DNA-binding response regulator [Lachnospiraceae bacterium]|nr:DNA-binding response regulator [Lachnospiraceae bacterium]